MRKEITVTISAEGRDQGKVFYLREMSAVRAEKWATRVLLALGRSGAKIPDDVGMSGLAGLAAIGLRAIAALDYRDAEPLLDEIMTCVQIIPDPSRPMVRRATIEDDFEEVMTLVQLRDEVLSLHLGFSIAASLSKLAASTMATAGLPNTETSDPPSAP
jgi:tail assembly chaperone